MTRYRLAPVVAFFCVSLGIPTPCRAQISSSREELLRLVPSDFGLCFVVNDLRGHAREWDKSRWIGALKESALGRALVNSSEYRSVLKLEQDLKKHLDIDWPALRDDVLGDAVVFAFEPGHFGKPMEEQGILLIHARRPEVLARLVDNLNRAQQAGGELTAVEPRTHNGTKYLCRLELKGSHYYLLDGQFFAYTAQEDLLKRMLDQRQQQTRAAPPLVQHLKKAGADSAVASLWINPRSFDDDLKRKVASVSGPEVILLDAFLKHWHALEALVFSISVHDNVEFKFSVQAREKELPLSARGFFTEPARPSDLWSRFPDNAIFGMAARVDGNEVADTFADFAPGDVRRAVQNALQPIAALTGIDIARDIAPNLGPDFGLCVLPAMAPAKMPQVVAALAVRPGPKDIAIDQSLYRGVHFLAGLFVFDYNRRNPQDPIRVNTLRQGAVEIKYLSHNKVFLGLEPACALKEGYLLLASSPDAVARFGAAAAPAAANAEAPLVRISSNELARALREHRQTVIDFFAANDPGSRMAAARGLDSALSVLDLLGRVEIVRTSGSGQASFVLRFHPARER